MTHATTLQHNSLGQTGISVSAIGLGTVKIGRNEGVKYPSGFELPDDKTVLNLLNLCAEMGVNLIDTAPAYGSSEERLGLLLPKLTARRQNWVICSKVGEEFEGGKSRFDFSARHVRHSIERSLKRLGTEYLDIVLIHSDGRDEEIITNTDCLEVLQRCRDAGLIRAFGMSTKTVEGGKLALKESDLAMVTYNASATADSEVIDLATKMNKGILIKKALNSGHSLQHPQTDSNALPSGHDPVRASMEFIFARPGICSIIVGSINPDHLRQNIQTAIDVSSNAAARRTHTDCTDSTDR